jgi:hypothetical protein
LAHPRVYLGFVQAFLGLLLLALLPVATLASPSEPFRLQLADLSPSADASDPGEAEGEPDAPGWDDPNDDPGDRLLPGILPAPIRHQAGPATPWRVAEAPPRLNALGSRRATGPPIP